VARKIAAKTAAAKISESNGNGGGQAKRVERMLRDSREYYESAQLLMESLAELELARDDEGWQRLGRAFDREFSNGFLTTIIKRARLMYLSNPMINRAVEVMRYYVFAQGVTIQARDQGRNKVVQAFLEDPSNVIELTGHQSRGLKEVALGTDGNVLLVFVVATDGRVQMRSIPVEEILAGDIITNPDDRRDVWYYKRVWTEIRLDVETGEQRPTQRTDYYPNWRYQPSTRPENIGADPVHWDMPVYHVKVGGTDGMRFGVPEVYAALDWAKAVKEDAEDYATIKRALARFVWDVAIRGGAKQVRAARDALQTGYPADETKPAPTVASDFVHNDAAALTPIKTAGAQPSPEEGRVLRLMVAAATGLPETILMGDADVGNLATAKTLDRPTELKIKDRQTLWTQIFRDVISIALRLSGDQAAKNTPASTSPELITTDDPETEIDEGVNVIWPPILEHDPEQWVKAIVSAATLDGKTPANTIPPIELVRIILSVFEIDGADEILETMFPNGDNGVLPYEAPPSPEEQLQMKADAAAKGGGPPAPAREEAFRRLGDALEKIVERQVERRRGAA
jgi:hypothetical protein